MTGSSWNQDRAAVNAAAGCPAGFPGLESPEVASVNVGIWNGRAAYLQEDGMPLMYVDDAREALA
jgi:hypothetical protein